MWAAQCLFWKTSGQFFLLHIAIRSSINIFSLKVSFFSRKNQALGLKNLEVKVFLIFQTFISQTFFYTLLLPFPFRWDIYVGAMMTIRCLKRNNHKKNTRIWNIFFMLSNLVTAQEMKFSIKDFFNECDQICSFLRIWSHLLKKILNGKLQFLWSVCFFK